MSITVSRRAPSTERGQILVLFTLSIVVIIGVVGLVIDGGSAFAQRRAEQNVADLAALAGATAALNTSGTAADRQVAAENAARATAAANGYVHGTDGVQLTVTSFASGTLNKVQVGVTRPHRNAFVGLLGFPTWDVSVDAEAISSRMANAVKGALPLLFNEEAFPNATCDQSSGTCADKIETYQLPGTGNEDVPQDATQFNWTIFCTASGNPCNANSDGVRDIIEGGGTATTIRINDDIGPLNAGSHTTLFNALEANAIGQTFPVPIVNDEGEMVGFAYFKLVSVEGGSEKVIKGFFVSPIDGSELEYIPTGGEASLDTGAYIAAELTD